MAAVYILSLMADLIAKTFARFSSSHDLTNRKYQRIRVTWGDKCDKLWRLFAETQTQRDPINECDSSAGDSKCLISQKTSLDPLLRKLGYNEWYDVKAESWKDIDDFIHISLNYTNGGYSRNYFSQRTLPVGAILYATQPAKSKRLHKC